MGMFDKPKTIVPAPKKALEKSKATVEIAGAEQLAMIDALQKTLETLRSTVEAEVKGAAADYCNAFIQKHGRKPDSFIATDGGAEVRIGMSRRSKTTALSESAIALLRENGIEPEKLVVTPELFAINPAYASDKALLAKVEKALAKIVPDDFIVQQEEVSKTVATEATLDTAIEKRAPAEVIAALTTITASCKLKETDMAAILDFVGGLIEAPVFGAAAEQSKAKKLRVVK